MAFSLTDHLEDIKGMAKSSGTTMARTVEDFVVNLTVMHGHYPGASQLNFHQLGQQWNKLTSREKVAQKKAAIEQLTTTPIIAEKPTVSVETRRRRSRDE